jgi:5'-3' exonuclease
MGVPRFYRFLQQRCSQIYTKMDWSHSIHSAIFSLENSKPFDNQDEIPTKPGDNSFVPLNTLLTPEQIQNSKVNYFYIDMNGLFHSVAQYTFCYDRHAFRTRSHPPTIKEFFHNITKTVDTLCQIVQPTNLFLAVDGVCPRAKQQQQRMRRYTGLIENPVSTPKASNEHMKSAGFSPIMLSPGTPLMNDLDRFLKVYVQRRNSMAFKTFYTSHAEAGEGEHKIVEYIRQHLATLSTQRHVVFGLDADYFMLAMGTRCPNMYLMRDDPFDNMIHVVSIDKVKTEVYKQMVAEKLKRKIHPDFHTTIDDFVLLSMLVGNDFLKPLAGFDDLFYTLDVALNEYTQFDKPLTIKQNLHHVNLREFLKKLESYQRTSIENHMGKKVIEKDPAIEKSRYGLIDPSNQTVTESVDVGLWRQAYYMDRFGIDESSPQGQMVIRRLCQKYYEGLDWNLKYYLKGCPQWTWYYSYHFSPVIEDVIDYKYQPVLFKKGEADPYYVQLLCILPPTHKDLVPEKYRGVMDNSELKAMYPTKVKASYKGCVVDWHCHMDLAFANHGLVEKLCAAL